MNSPIEVKIYYVLSVVGVLITLFLSLVTPQDWPSSKINLLAFCACWAILRYSRFVMRKFGDR